MFLIPGSLIAMLTFPGVIVHEIAHRIFCDLCGVPVLKVCYFRRGNPAGYVIHVPVSSLGSGFLISVGPIIVNTLLSMFLGYFVAMPLSILHSQPSLIQAFVLWLAISIGMHAFPSCNDMENFTALAKQANPFIHIAARCIELFCKLANVLRFVWFDLIYAYALAVFIPSVGLCLYASVVG